MFLFEGGGGRVVELHPRRSMSQSCHSMANFTAVTSILILALCLDFAGKKVLLTIETHGPYGQPRIVDGVPRLDELVLEFTFTVVVGKYVAS